MTEAHDQQGDPLDVEIAAYDRMKERLEATVPGKWAVVADQKLWRTFDTFHDAASAAEQHLGGTDVHDSAGWIQAGADAEFCAVR